MRSRPDVGASPEHERVAAYHAAMASSSGRSILASVVGWVVVALVVWFLFGWVLGTLRFILRMIVIIVVIGALASLYFKLRNDD